MSLSPGARLAAYEILAPIGAGGMGEVYRARDTRLGREVAIKVVSEAFSRDEERLARFEREARLLASLNHPAIATLYGLEESGGLRFLVMELVEGETLGERIARGPVPIDEALPLFQQIAEGLEAAHQKGIVHRDLKPANIKITPQGKIKVLDFGLAKAHEAEPGDVDLSQSPTLTREGTKFGVLLGTAPYMSPEQARGIDVDTRTDIWAFGCCFYEVLCHRPAFPGQTVSDTIAKILERDPDWEKLPPGIPVSVQRLLRRCLQKDAGRRLQAIGDARIEIEEARNRTATARRGSESIAVLPFLTLSTDPEDEFFSDGITEDIIAELSKIGALKVISRTSVMPFKKRELGLREIAGKLRVETVLEGSVRRAGNRVRIVAQLIDAETDQHLWAERYDRELTDIFAIQSDVAINIAAALQAELSPDEKTRIGKPPTSDIEAYQLYLRGRHCWGRYTQEGLRTSLEYFEKAIGRDPSYALAYADMGIVYLIIGLGYGAGTLTSEEAYRRSREAVAKALALDSELGAAHSTSAMLMFIDGYDWTGAEREFERAIALSPGDPWILDGYGLMLSSLARYDEAIAAQKRAQELDPLTPVHSSDLASTLLRAGRYDEALREAERLIAVEPDFPMGHSTLGWAYLKKGMGEEGLAELERAFSLSRDNTIFLAQLGQAYAMEGKVEKAREALQELTELSKKRYVSPYHMAYIYTGLNEKEKAMDCLERAHQEHSGGIYSIKGSFLFTSLHDHPRFKTLLKRLNLD